MREHDLRVRAELAATGELFAGYHARMAAVHEAHALQLRQIIGEHGWPDADLVGDDGAEAAWLVAQHAIGEPAFMRTCRHLVDVASAAGRIPRWQFAYLDDRIRTFEGRRQRYGTQLRRKRGDVAPCPLVDASRVDEWRRQVGLPPLADVLARERKQHARPPTRAEVVAAHHWRRRVGWLGAGEDRT